MYIKNNTFAFRKDPKIKLYVLFKQIFLWVKNIIM